MATATFTIEGNTVKFTRGIGDEDELFLTLKVGEAKGTADDGVYTTGDGITIDLNNKQIMSPELGSIPLIGETAELKSFLERPAGGRRKARKSRKTKRRTTRKRSTRKR